MACGAAGGTHHQCPAAAGRRCVRWAPVRAACAWLPAGRMLIPLFPPGCSCRNSHAARSPVPCPDLCPDPSPPSYLSLSLPFAALAAVGVIAPQPQQQPATADKALHVQLRVGRTNLLLRSIDRQPVMELEASEIKTGGWAVGWVGARGRLDIWVRGRDGEGWGGMPGSTQRYQTTARRLKVLTALLPIPPFTPLPTTATPGLQAHPGRRAACCDALPSLPPASGPSTPCCRPGSRWWSPLSCCCMCVGEWGAGQWPLLLKIARFELSCCCMRGGVGDVVLRIAW